MFDTTRRRTLQALGIGGTATVAGCIGTPEEDDETVQTTADRMAQ